MNEFLKHFDEMIGMAMRDGDCNRMWRYNGPAVDADTMHDKLKLVARTMHPSFMSGPIPKWDPNRDKED
jgi:hypothetical protein